VSDVEGFDPLGPSESGEPGGSGYSSDPNAAGEASELGTGGTATATASHRGAGRGRPDYILLGLRGIGQTLITCGLIILLFVVYEVWVSNIFAAQKQDAVRKTFQQEIVSGDNPLVGATQAALPGSTQATIPTGTGIANIYMPRLGDDYHFTIVEGTNDADLEKGPGHYSGTALPGQVGNFSVAGHRVGKGEPFLNLDQLKPGDAIVIETVTNWYVYRVLGDVASGDLSTPGIEGVVGREIVKPSAVNVVLPVPDHPGVTPTASLITLTTCHPKFTATDRMIIHGSLVRTVPRQGDALPKELSGGTI
jgi:sortase A